MEDSRPVVSPVVLFCCLPFEGHVRPVARVADALSRLGCCGIDFAAMEDSRRTVEELAPSCTFVSLGHVSEEQRQRAQVVFDTSQAAGTMSQRAKRAAGTFATIEELMYPPLKAHLEQEPGRYAAVCTDQATAAAMDVAAAAGLPLVVLHQLPLGYALVMAGREQYNAPRHVPLELPGRVLPEAMGWLQAALLNPLLKWRSTALFKGAYARRRGAVRARLSLPALPAGHGPLEAPPGVPRQLHVLGGSLELEVRRKLPPGWHVTGPHGLPPSDGGTAALDPVSQHAALAAFLGSAAAAGQAVVYVALGSLVAPHQALVRAMAAAWAAVPGARFVWALKQASHAFLPPELLPPGGGDGGSRVMVMAWAPQPAVLAHPAVRLFVSHGGLGSLYEGLSRGKPLLVMPFFADQHINAQHLANTRLGGTVDPSPSELHTLPRRLSDAITALLADEGMATRAAALGERLRAVDGARQAAELVQGFLVAEADKEAAAHSGV